MFAMSVDHSYNLHICIDKRKGMVSHPFQSVNKAMQGRYYDYQQHTAHHLLG
jgi:hypothetical protein